MEDVAVDHAEALLEIERRQHLAGDHRRFEVRRMPRHRVDDEIGEGLLLARVGPAAAIGQMRRHVLHEQARDVLARGRQRRIERRGDQHLDDRLARPAGHARIEIGALQIVERRPDDDAGAVVVLRVRARAGR